MEKDFDAIITPLLGDYSVRQRTVGVGRIAEQQAQELGAVGPVAKACGIARNLRTTGYAAYGELDFQVITETAGDCFARTQVRVRELGQCVQLVRAAIARIPAGSISVPVKGNPLGETVSRVEQPRGEVVYYIKGNGTKNLERFRVRTPTFANIPVLLTMLPGCHSRMCP